jgi:hypothetical protein
MQAKTSTIRPHNAMPDPTMYLVKLLTTTCLNLLATTGSIHLPRDVGMRYWLVKPALCIWLLSPGTARKRCIRVAALTSAERPGSQTWRCDRDESHFGLSGIPDQ